MINLRNKEYECNRMNSEYSIMKFAHKDMILYRCQFIIILSQPDKAFAKMVVHFKCIELYKCIGYREWTLNNILWDQ